MKIFFNKLKKFQFDVIINCSAYNDVDKAENEYDLAECINHYSISEISNYVKKNNLIFIHISTDYVFNGENNKAYLESDIPAPISKYGLSKYNGEQAIINSCCKAIIIRTSWLFSEFRDNFVKKIILNCKKNRLLKVVNDQLSAPTYSHHLAEMIVNICLNKKYIDTLNSAEIFHFCNDGYTTRYDFAKQIIKIMKIDCKIEPTNSIIFNSLAKRPKYSLLDNNKVKNIFDIQIKHWKDSLIECLKKI